MRSFATAHHAEDEGVGAVSLELFLEPSLRESQEQQYVYFVERENLRFALRRMILTTAASSLCTLASQALENKGLKRTTISIAGIPDTTKEAIRQALEMSPAREVIRNDLQQQMAHQDRELEILPSAIVEARNVLVHSLQLCCFRDDVLHRYVPDILAESRIVAAAPETLTNEARANISKILIERMTTRSELMETAQAIATQKKRFLDCSDHLIRCYLPLVVSIIKKNIFQSIPLEDRLSSGSEGLRKALATFLLSKKFQFSTYATACITNALKRCRIDQQRDWAKFESRRLNLSVENMGEELEDAHSPLKGLRYAKAQEAVDMILASETLTGREKSILSLFFGLEGKGEMTLQAIGRHLGLSKERVRQIKMEAMTKLRATYENPFKDEE